MTEAQLQAAVVRYLDACLPEGAVYHHSPNEGKRGWRAQAAIASHGVQKGWPDVEVIWRGRVIFIELKALGKYLRPAQKDMHRRLTLAGAVVTTCRTVEEVDEFLSTVIPMKGRVAA